MRKFIDKLSVIGYVIFSSTVYLFLFIISILICVPVKIYRGLYERFLDTKS